MPRCAAAMRSSHGVSPMSVATLNGCRRSAILAVSMKWKHAGRTPNAPNPSSKHGGIRWHASKSEAHTYETQSLMRISYAVYSLNKQKHPSQARSAHHQTTTIHMHTIYN